MLLKAKFTVLKNVLGVDLAFSHAKFVYHGCKNKILAEEFFLEATALYISDEWSIYIQEIIMKQFFRGNSNGTRVEELASGRTRKHNLEGNDI